MSTPTAESADRPPAERDPGAAGGSQAWAVVAEVAGAVAGFAVVLYAIGGAVMAARLKALELPVDSTVALLSTGTLIVLALKLLAVSLIVGGLTFALLEWGRQSTFFGRALAALKTHIRTSTRESVKDPATESSDQARSRKTADAVRRMMPRGRSEALVASLVIVGSVVYQILLTPMGWASRLLTLAVGMFAVVGAIWIFESDLSLRRRAYALLLLVAVLTGSLRALSELLPPTRLDYVALSMKNGDLLEGYHLAETKEAVILAPNVYNRTINMVSVVPRGDISHAAISLEPVDVLALGTKVQSSLVSTGLAEPQLSPEAEVRRDEVLAFLASIRTDPGWRYPPRVPWDTAEYLIRNFDEFDEEPHEFTLDGAPVDLEDLLVDPQLYLAEAVRTEGRLVRAHATPPFDGFISQILVLKADRVRGEASCRVTTPANARRFRAGQLVDVRAVVTAWGTWVSRAHDETQLLALTCSAARLSRASRSGSARGLRVVTSSQGR